MNDQWLNDLKRHMDGYETDAPEGLWEGIESALSETKANSPVIAPSKPRVTRLWTRVASVAAILAAIIIGCGLLLQHDEFLQPIDSQIAAVAPPINDNRPASSCDSSEKPAEEPAFTSLATTSRPTASTKTYAATVTTVDNMAEPVDKTPTQTDLQATETVSTESQTTESAESAPDYPRPLPTPEQLPEARRSERRYYAEAKPRQRNTDAGRISVGFNSGTGFMPEFKDYDADIDYIGSPSLSGTTTNKLTDYLYAIQTPEPSFDPKTESAEHSLPIRVAATVSYAVTDRFSIESGLTFTTLHSEVYYSYNPDIIGSYKGNSSSWKGDRNLFYLGIPITARYTFASGSSFDVYGAGGFTVEKCVAGKTKIHCISKGFEYTDAHSFTSRVDPLQWSVRASLGIQWRILPQLGLYAEPGISYFFNNHSDSRHRALPISTYYTEHPLNYSLSIGLRLMLPQ